MEEDGGEEYMINNEKEENVENYEVFDDQGNNEHMQNVEYEEIEEEQHVQKQEEEK